MKIAFVTDLHFGARNDNQKVAEHQKMFYDRVFFPYLDEHNITNVINLGDTFDRRKFISYTSLKAAKEMFFDPLKEREIETHIIVGNHDITYKNTLEVNSIDLLLDGYDNCHEWSVPHTLNMDGLDILLMPWICRDNFDLCWDEIKSSRAQVLLGHLELNGFQMYKGMPSYEGFDAESFSKFDLVCSGHYHHRSTVGNISYLGTAYEMTWSCYDDPKGFHMFDTDTRELEFIENPYKLFYKLWYDDDKLTFDHLDVFDFENMKDKYIKVIIKNKNNPALFDAFITSLENQAPINVQVVEDHLNLDLDDDDEIVNEAEDTLSIVSNYIDSLEIKTNKNELNVLMRNLYNEALSIE
tara:strand:+ start:784 stop:1845 length:1062 start_codon:yes stop_codon:yes gene_type:complete